MNHKPLGQLLTDSWSFFQSHFMVLLVGAILFGVVSGYVAQSMQKEGEKFATHMMDGTGGMFTQEKMEKMAELTMKAMQGDEAAELELEAMGEEMEAMAGTMEDRMMDDDFSPSGFAGSFAKNFGKGFLLSMLISALAAAYFLSIAVFGIADVGLAFNKTIGNVLPILGLWIWIFIRTFVWIPVLGIILGIILGPRFIIAPLHLLEGKKSIFDSASMSYEETKGKWGKIFGNMFVAGIIVWIAVMVLGMALAAFGLVGGLLLGILSQLGTAFLMVFGIQLARAVK